MPLSLWSPPTDSRWARFCVMDRIPRDLSAAQREALGALSRQVEAQLELRGDVAELHVAEHALVETRELAEAARAAAEQASQAKSFFLANMSHELRTPLNAIIGYSEMLQEEARDSGHDQYLADLEKIRVAGKHLLGTINDVLDLSKIEAGKTNLHVEPFDVDLMVRDVVGTIRPVVERNGNRFEISRESNLGTMRSDATKIRQCIINVLGNAGKFTERGLVRLEVSRAAESGSDWLTFRVSDTGIGMTSAQAGGLFEPFIQGDESTTRKYGGTGLGLALTRRYCRLMGGDISVRSEIGRGSTFTIRLPAEPAPVPSRTMAVAPFSVDTLSRSAEVHAGAPRALLIDDDPDACELLSRLLMREGYQVAFALSGDQGLGLARANHPRPLFWMSSCPAWMGGRPWQRSSRIPRRPVFRWSWYR